MEAQSYNIAILPDLETQARAIEMSKKLATELKTEFILDGKNLYPHITVYQAHYPLKNLQTLIGLASQLVESVPRSISLNAFDISHATFVFWSCDNDKTLRTLHDNVVKVANPLRESLILPQLSNIEEISPEDQYDIERFGSLLIGPRYLPHITLTRLSSVNDEKKARGILGGSKQVNFKPKSLIIGNLGAHGTVTGIIEEFTLS